MIDLESIRCPHCDAELAERPLADGPIAVEVLAEAFGSAAADRALWRARRAAWLLSIGSRIAELRRKCGDDPIDADHVEAVELLVTAAAMLRRTGR